MVESTRTFPFLNRSGGLPEVPFDSGLRLEVAVTDIAGVVLASGSTPEFDFDNTENRLDFRVQVTESDGFAPVGSIVVDRETGGRKFATSQFDYRGTDRSWLGRAGHATAVTDDGKILIAGGGQLVPGGAPGATGNFDSVYNDVQIFDPETGYFTDLDLSLIHISEPTRPY